MPKYDCRWAPPRACKFSVSPFIARADGRETACGRRTQDPVESPRTLLHAPPQWLPSGEDESRRGRISRPAASHPHAAPARMASPVLGRYRLLERLGQGGFGEVWRAHDELLHREVAVKRILLGPDRDSERATREALAAARLSHPAIVALYEAGAVDDAFYLISELVDGDTLARLIAEHALDDEAVLEIGVALTDALSHAHARGVIHRDIKPQNVLIPHRPEGAAAVAKLTDFGGASLVGEDALTRTGDVLGTLAYMAPEQSEGREVGREADLYALALVLYEALCGVNPVRGPTPAATARRIGTVLTPLARARADLPRSLTHALDEALAPCPPDRGTLDQLRLALEEALERGLRRSRRWRRRPPAHPQQSPELPVPLAAATAEQPPPARRQPRAPEVTMPADVRESPASSRLAVPRALWMACALAPIVWQVWAGRAGVGLLLLAGVLPLVALPRRATPAWLLSGLAPVLGLIGLAGAFPALAGQPGRWRERAAIAALGYWWLTLAEPFAAARSGGRALWLGAPSGIPARAVWESSLSSSAVHVLAPMLSLGVLLGATLWAAGALVLPWIVRGRSAALDLVAAAAWSAALVAAAPALDAGLSAQGAYPVPRGAVLGAILGGMVAVAARALRGPV